MPEGPEIRRLRDRLAEAIEGETAQRIEFHLPRLTEWNGRLDGCRITAIESRGKALLTHLDSGHSIYSHNQLYGRWYVVPPGELPDTRRQLRLAIHTRRHRALLYSASDIEVWLSMANNFDPLSANKIDPPGATKISSRVCASVDSSLLPA